MSFLSPLRRLFREEKRVGLVLGAGGARGLAHIGVLKVLQSEGIPLHCVVGTSAGALVGGLYCAGLAPGKLEELALQFSTRDVAKLFLPSFSRGGFIDGERVERFIQPFTDNKVIDDLSPRFACVATDLFSGERVVFKSGDLLESIRASISIPGMFTPAIHGERVLVDGGMVDPLPIGLAFELGATIVIAVHVGRPLLKKMTWRKKEGKISGIRNSIEMRLDRHLRGVISSEESPDWLRNPLQRMIESYEKARNKKELVPPILEIVLSTISIFENRLSELQGRDAGPYLMVEPSLADVEMLDFQKGRQAITAGEEAMRCSLPELRCKLISRIFLPLLNPKS